jgi:RNA polymerase sigma factor (sigma-70 family)
VVCAGIAARIHPTRDREPTRRLRARDRWEGGTALEALTDAEIIASSGPDPGQFALIFDRHFAAIHRYLHRRVGRELAEDLAAETFAVALRRRAGYDPHRADARPWLFGIAANLLRHHRRTERRQLVAYARTGADRVSEGGFEAADERVDADAAGPALAGALGALKPWDREVLLLHAWADLTYQEIADALSIPVGTVRSRLARARGRVRELLSANGQSLGERKTRGGTRHG